MPPRVFHHLCLSPTVGSPRSLRRRGSVERAPGRIARRAPSWILAGIAAYSFAATTPALAAPPPAATSAGVVRGELPPLPEIPPATLPKPAPADIEQLDAILNTLVATGNGEHRAAASEVATVHAGLVPAIAQRLDHLADGANRARMKELLLEIRKAAREDIRRELKESGQQGKVETPDYFEMVVARPAPDRAEWRELVQALAMSRMLTAIETVQSVRVLVEVYARFNFLRVDTQLQLQKLGDRAIAGLIEARRHRAAEVGRWAARELDAFGRAIPGEAVQVRDPEALADILRAYGRVRDPDAARIVVSFANSERTQLRDAARQGIAMMGEVAMWQLRDAYENTVGKRPPRDWSWQRLARKLFAEYDRLRLSQVYLLYDEGRAAEARGDLFVMHQAYDKVLTRSPIFEHRATMAAGYLAFAAQFADRDAAAAAGALDRAARITTDRALLDRIESLRLTLHAERLLTQGVADQELLVRAVDLDADNDRARRLMAGSVPDATLPEARRSRWTAALAIAILAAIGALVVGFWPRRRRGDEDPPPSDGGAGPARRTVSGPSLGYPNPAEEDSAAGEAGTGDNADPTDAPAAEPVEPDRVVELSSAPQPIALEGTPAPSDEAEGVPPVAPPAAEPPETRGAVELSSAPQPIVVEGAPAPSDEASRILPETPPAEPAKTRGDGALCSAPEADAVDPPAAPSEGVDPATKPNDHS
ncbi:MAG: hypothetical protein JW751_12760 [Polyangiaceae bacterium]|nr:hypothetical protein [Polyangiaceae bacterium]